MRYEEGNYVRLRVGQSASWTDEDLEQEGEDPRVRVRISRGTVGRVVKVREHPTPFPYVVLFGDQELGVREDDLERVAAP